MKATKNSSKSYHFTVRRLKESCIF